MKTAHGVLIITDEVVATISADKLFFFTTQATFVGYLATKFKLFTTVACAWIIRRTGSHAFLFFFGTVFFLVVVVFFLVAGVF